MAVSHKNAVHEVLNAANIKLETAVGAPQTFGGLQHAANVAVNNTNTISGVAKSLGKAIDGFNADNQPSQSQSVLEVKQHSVLGSVLWAGAAIAASAVNPLVGGAFALAGTTKETVDFAVGHAAVDGAKGELTLAGSAASFDKKGEMATYTPYCEQDVTYNVQTGQKTKPPTVANTPVGLASLGASPQDKMDAAAVEVAGQHTPEKIAADVRHLLEQEQRNYAWAQQKYEELGVEDSGVKGMSAPKQTFKAPSFG